MEILEELRALQRDLADLGDAVAVALLERAEKAFLRWQFDAGERCMEQALSRVQESLEQPKPAPISGASPGTSRRARWRSHDCARPGWFNGPPLACQVSALCGMVLAHHLCRIARCRRELNLRRRSAYLPATRLPKPTIEAATRLSVDRSVSGSRTG